MTFLFGYLKESRSPFMGTVCKTALANPMYLARFLYKFIFCIPDFILVYDAGMSGTIALAKRSKYLKEKRLKTQSHFPEIEDFAQSKLRY
jgi:hypothetical protein